jgi:hypothetical protein
MINAKRKQCSNGSRRKVAGPMIGIPICGFEWNPGEWPYAATCCRDAGHDGNHRTKNGKETPQPTTTMRRFVLDRREDVSGTSGTGIVAEGVVFTDATTVLRWTVALKSTAIYGNIVDLMDIHGHDGKTKIRWLDD